MPTLMSAFLGLTSRGSSRSDEGSNDASILRTASFTSSSSLS